MRKVITRFAPSPTGSLHLGGARTALFNWLFAKNNNGLFKLRIEDTDKLRSKNIYVDEIRDALIWLGLKWDGDIEFQSKNIIYHIEIVDYLLKNKKAYKCYCTKEQIEADRKLAYEKKIPYRYNGRCRDLKDTNNLNKPFVIRVKSPKDGVTKLNDKVLGKVSVKNENIDDFIILRTDRTPTYMLSVVADDRKMSITDVIRGDDHLTNTFKQIILFDLLKWKLPNFSHIPLIHGADGNKLSKRHGAVNVTSYREEGYLSKAFNNYLLRLGWGYKDKEIFSDTEATKLFDIKGIGKSPARFDKKKLDYLNSYYIRNVEWKSLIKESPFKEISKELLNNQISDKLIKLFRERAESLADIVLGLKYMLSDNYKLTDEAKNIITNANFNLLKIVTKRIDNLNDWSSEKIGNLIKVLALENNVKVYEIAAPLRASITGQKYSPSIFLIIEYLGKERVIQRLKKAFCK